MTSPSPDPPSQAEDVVRTLASELSEIRNRGLDGIDRNNQKQKLLQLPVMGSIVRGSPWATESRPLAVRRVIARSIPYCNSAKVRRALQALYGIDTDSQRAPEERRHIWLRALDTSAGASAEFVKARVREVREQLARAVLAASANDFEEPDPDTDYLDHDELALPSLTRTVLDELRLLAEGRGVSVRKIEAQAPVILGLPSVRDQYIRSSGTEDQAECAVDVLRCATRVSTMRGPHRARLVADMLNLRQTTKTYDQRRDAYRLVAQVSVEDFKALEDRAYVRYAKLLVSLDRSPCLAEIEKSLENMDRARNLAGLLLSFSEEDKYEVAHHLVYLIEEALPGFARIGIELPDHQVGNIGKWFASLIERVGGEYAEWVRQYGDQIDDKEEFLNIDLVSSALMPALERSTPSEMNEAHGEVIERYSERLKENPAPNDLSAYYSPFFNVRERFTRALRSALMLLAQLLVYNEENDYWPTASNMNNAPVDIEASHFPIVPIADFDPERVRVDQNF